MLDARYSIIYFHYQSHVPILTQRVSSIQYPVSSISCFKRIKVVLFECCIFVKNESMTKLSVNINKIATLRNARGGNLPDVLQVAQDCERFGAEGITVHPRPDERHIRFRDVYGLKPVLTTEFNIEGYPSMQ